MTFSDYGVQARNLNQTKYCTFDTCPLSTSFWHYRPSLVINIVFLALFATSLLGFLVTHIFRQRFISFTIALASCSILEILGYLGRILAHSNPWNETGFLLQIICLTIAPTFAAGGIYLCLRNIVYAFGKENSRIEPETYTRFFIPCDVVSLVLQALGGGMASVASHEGRDPKVGDIIMLAGLVVQAVTLLIFMTICIDFGFRTMQSSTNESTYPKSASHRSDKKLQGFLVAIGTATVCIFIRSIYRVVELGQGWNKHLIRQQ